MHHPPQSQTTPSFHFFCDLQGIGGQRPSLQTQSRQAQTHSIGELITRASSSGVRSDYNLRSDGRTTTSGPSEQSPPPVVHQSSHHHQWSIRAATTTISRAIAVLLQPYLTRHPSQHLHIYCLHMVAPHTLVGLRFRPCHFILRATVGSFLLISCKSSKHAQSRQYRATSYSVSRSEASC